MSGQSEQVREGGKTDSVVITDNMDCNCSLEELTKLCNDILAGDDVNRDLEGVLGL